MRIGWIQRSAFLFFIAACAGTARAVVYDDGGQPQAFVRPGVLIVKYAMPLEVNRAQASSAAPGAHIGVESIDRIHDRFRVQRVDRLFPKVTNPRFGTRPRTFDRYGRIGFPLDTDLEELKRELEAQPLVESVDYAVCHPVDAVPNDPSFGTQWQYQDASDNDIDGPAAWDIVSGDSLIILGDTDTGVNHEHPDLAGPSPYTGGNIWINWTEWNGTVGVDDDGNGYEDDLRGWDFVDGVTSWPGEDGSFQDNNPMDFNGHGTHTGGIMAAMTNNAVGGAGTAGGFYNGQRGCKIMCLRIGWSQSDGGVERGFVGMDFAAQAFDYGVMMGVKVFNCSWGSSGSSGFGEAVSNALAAGVNICTSAGNSGSQSSSYLANHSGVLNVASTTSSDIKSGFSSFGTNVDVSAPGSSIYNTYSNHTVATYGTLSGTSMASPHVAGLVGLIRAKNPELEKAKVDSVIKATTDPIDHLNPFYAGLIGTGRINAAAALAGTPIADFYADVVFGQAPLSVSFFDHSYLHPVAWNWNLGNGETPAAQNTSTVYASAGLYTVSLTAQTDLGPQTTTRASFIQVIKDSIGGLEGEAGVHHSGSVNLILHLTVPVDSVIFPFATSGPAAITLDTVLLDLPGSSLFSSSALDNFLAGTGMGVLKFKSDSGGAITPGTVEVARFVFSVGQGIPGEAMSIVATSVFPSDSFAVYSPRGVYVPDLLPTLASVGPYLLGDVNLTGFVTSADVIDMVNYIFKSGSVPVIALADVDGTPPATAGDIIYLINYLFKSGPPPIG